jgi:hypothetical protein
MVSPSTITACVGKIAIIDIPNRSLVLRQATGAMVEFIVAPSCRIVLNGEPVRLRLLLIGDEVEATYIDHGETLTAWSIEVHTRHRVSDETC